MEPYSTTQTTVSSKRERYQSIFRIAFAVLIGLIMFFAGMFVQQEIYRQERVILNRSKVDNESEIIKLKEELKELKALEENDDTRLMDPSQNPASYPLDQQELL